MPEERIQPDKIAKLEYINTSLIIQSNKLRFLFSATFITPSEKDQPPEIIMASMSNSVTTMAMSA
ncbi:MAG: hypothetical protein MJA29_10120 [Candidatus Omnitrophica bacterium]|nr:hypothetical protein [Candidatus Omnitrophota bacterium]